MKGDVLGRLARGAWRALRMMSGFRLLFYTLVWAAFDDVRLCHSERQAVVHSVLAGVAAGLAIWEIGFRRRLRMTKENDQAPPFKVDLDGNHRPGVVWGGRVDRLIALELKHPEVLDGHEWRFYGIYIGNRGFGLTTARKKEKPPAAPSEGAYR